MEFHKVENLGQVITSDNGRPDCNHTFWVRNSGVWVNQSGQGNVITTSKIGKHQSLPKGSDHLLSKGARK